ncbi:MAG: deoxyhypusine synthase family protein [Planctomycetota bacterium]|jgi:deoxyhypusine synthase|nr:deoxyhypusine synthase family protein [Planctomycetota bacterium]
MGIRDFMETHYRHFNARETREAAQAWVDHLEGGGKMFLALAGAMSTGELGISLASMIREKRVHAISVTGANVEEDLYSLLARPEYKLIPGYRDLTPRQETELFESGLNRVTDVCIPERVMYQLDDWFKDEWKRTEEAGERRRPFEFVSAIIDSGVMERHYQNPPEHSWVLAAHEMKIPVWVPGWEDSTSGSSFASEIMRGFLKDHRTVKTGTEQLQEIGEWYRAQSKEGIPVGFFQIGGGIAGDFAICAVPMLIQDLKEKDIPFWSYFCQIGDATTSYGSYSGAVPNEKITWGKLGEKTPRFMIQSDASLVAPLIFGYVLDE